VDLRAIGRLESIGQLERDIESGEHLAMVDRQFGLEPLGADAFAPDAVLLLVEERFGDAVVVVGGEQLAFLAV
jgi:hypothetical protein